MEINGKKSRFLFPFPISSLSQSHLLIFCLSKSHPRGAGLIFIRATSCLEFIREFMFSNFLPLQFSYFSSCSVVLHSFLSFCLPPKSYFTNSRGWADWQVLKTEVQHGYTATPTWPTPKSLKNPQVPNAPTRQAFEKKLNLEFWAHPKHKSWNKFQIERMNRQLLSRESNALISYCYKEKKPCVGWVQTYLGDCLCNLADRLSFGFGLVSLVAWAVAEVPQIITNFQTKSSHGISIIFLFTWVLGDAFNLAGCLLEPATLPTQYYTALFYTVTTLILVLQSVYYDHFYPWWKCRERKSRVTQQDGEEKTPLNPNKEAGEDEEGSGGGGIPIPSTAAPWISELPRPHTASKEFYYTSARSLAGSNTPPFRSYMRVAKSGPSTTALGEHCSSEDENEIENASTSPAAVPVKTQPRSIPRLAAKGAMLATAFNLPARSNAMAVGYKGFTGRRFLQERDVEYSGFGQCLGWMMAAIYMGGRIPQIALNIKRGSVEGLNPLMFIFALVGNVTYVASILVRSTEWEKTKANLPWLLDAVVCVGLDLFIILQYVYYQYILKKDFDGNDEEKDYYVEVNPKALVA